MQAHFSARSAKHYYTVYSFLNSRSMVKAEFCKCCCAWKGVPVGTARFLFRAVLPGLKGGYSLWIKVNFENSLNKTGFYKYFKKKQKTENLINSPTWLNNM